MTQKLLNICFQVDFIYFMLSQAKGKRKERGTLEYDNTIIYAKKKK